MRKTRRNARIVRNMQKHIQIFLSISVAALLLPTGVSAAQITALETVAGLGSEVTLTDLPPRSQVQLSIASPIGKTMRQTLDVGSNGSVSIWIAGNDLQVAGQYELSAMTQDNIAVRGTLAVHPDSIDTITSTIVIDSTSVNAGNEVLATVIAADRFGNALQGRSMELLSSRSDDLVQAMTRETDAGGQQQFIVRPSMPGTLALRAIDLISGQTLRQAVSINAYDPLAPSVGGPVYAPTYGTNAFNTMVASQQFYRGNPSAANLTGNAFPANPYRAQTSDPPRFDHVQIDIVGQEGKPMPALEQYKAESLLLTVVDQYGNRFYDFTGTIYLATTDPEATLPAFGVYDFAFEDEGQKMLTLGLKFASVDGNQPTQHTMVLTQRADEIPTDLEQALGYLVVTVTPKQFIETPEQQIYIVSPAARSLLNETDVVVQGSGPSFINITVTGGVQDAEGETDRQGNFSIPITLDPTKAEQTITVQDRDAPGNAVTVEFSLDVTPPAIQSITFTPENPMEETDVLVVVQSEPGLKDFSLTLNDQTYTLTSTDPASGKYQMLLTAPTGGQYEAVVNVSDALGNAVQESVPLTVKYRGLPTVQNVLTEAKINSIALSWDPLEDETIEAYRIYVGTDPGEFLYTLDTDRPAAAATVAGLRPGTTYYFAVTALQDKRESDEKSDTVQATVLGVKLKITPQDGALFIEWNELQQDMPLSNFILEYGVDPGQLTEQRTLNGQLRAYTLRDLINGVTYYLKLTPIATTGQRVDDLAADGQSTPTGAGFTPGTSDPVIGNLHGSAGAPTHIGNPPTKIPLSQEGIPAWMLWSILGFTGVLFHAYLRHRRQTETAAAFLQAMQSRYHQ